MYTRENIQTHPLYHNALTMVLWGESKEQVYHMFTVNNLPPKTSDLIYAEARRDRIQTLRAETYPRIIKGSLITLVSIGAFYAFWYLMGGITVHLLILCCSGLAWGMVKLLTGIVELMLAARKEGAI